MKLFTISIVFGSLLLQTSCSEDRTDQQKNTEVLVKPDHDSMADSSESEIEWKEARDTIESVPTELRLHIPAGFSVIDTSFGDLNNDGLIDAILVLKQNGEEKAESTSPIRPLLLLENKGDNSYQLIARNDHAILNSNDGGAFGDPFQKTSIQNGEIAILHWIAGGMHWEHEVRFRYDQNERSCFLNYLHHISWKMNDSTDPEAEALVVANEETLTDKDFGKIPLNDFNIHQTFERSFGKH